MSLGGVDAKEFEHDEMSSWQGSIRRSDRREMSIKVAYCKTQPEGTKHSPSLTACSMMCSDLPSGWVVMNRR